MAAAVGFGLADGVDERGSRAQVEAKQPSDKTTATCSSLQRGPERALAQRQRIKIWLFRTFPFFHHKMSVGGH